MSEEMKAWPDCAPIDQTDPFWETNNNLNVNGTAYKKEEVAPGRWEWRVNEAAMRSMANYEQAKSDLAWALRSRVLTDDEMESVRQHDYHLFVRPGQSYRETEMRQIFNDALAQQFRLRALASTTDSGEGN